MNIKELEIEKPSFVLCFEALCAVIAVTAIFYGLYRYFRLVFRTSRKRKARSKEYPSRVCRCLRIISTPVRMICHAFLWLGSRKELPHKDIEPIEED